MRHGVCEDNRAVKTIGNGVHKLSLGGLLVDLLGFNGALVVFDVGTWTDGTFAFKLEHSADGTTWTTVDAAEIEGTCPTVDSDDDDAAVYEVGYIGGHQYMRASVDVTGDPVTGCAFGAVVIRMDPAVRPSGATVA